MTPRPYQIEAVDSLRVCVGKGKRRVILQASCGAGKTVCACILIQKAVSKGSKVLFLAGARELIHQCSRKLDEFGIRHGVIMAGHGYTRADVQVASKDTLVARALKAGTLELPKCDIVIVDECHGSTSATYQKLLAKYPFAIVIGLTATPARGDGKELGTFYDDMVQVIPTSKLIAMGHLVPVKCFCPYKPNLKGVKTAKGDYVKQDLAKRMNRPEITGDIVSHWLKLGQNRQTVAFTVTIAHSKAITEAFLKAGVPAEHIDGTMNQTECDAILKRFNDGTTRILSSCNKLTTGIDFPCAACAILARPTKSFVLFKQIVGRILRPYDGPLGKKTDSILLDHAGCVYMHGFPDDDVDWKLKKGETIQDKIAANTQGANEPFVCPRCKTAFRKTNVCPGCGFKLPERKVKKTVTQKDGVLVAIQKAPDAATKLEFINREWRQCLAITAAKGGSVSMAAAMFIRATHLKPWEVPGLANLPTPSQYGLPVAAVFPNFRRRTT